MRLIDADELMQIIPTEEYNARMAIIFAPTVDAKPVKHGHWIDVNGDGSLWRCSVCGEAQCCYDNYCGNCGADMRAEHSDVPDTNVGNTKMGESTMGQVKPSDGERKEVETGNTYSIGKIELPKGVFRQIYDEERREDVETD